MLDLFNSLNPWLILLTLVSIAIFLSITICWLIFRSLRWHGKSYEEESLYNKAVKKLQKPITYFLALILTIKAVEWTPTSSNYTLFSFTSNTATTITLLLRIGFYAIGAWTLLRIINIFIQIIEERNNLSVNKADNLQQRKIATQLQFIQKIAAIIVLGVAVSLALLEFDEVRKIGAGMLTSAGVAGIIIGLAAQKSIANLLAGLQIAFTQPIRIDDAIIVEGEFGNVEEITLTYVVVRIWDQRRMIVPLNHFIEKPFQNWTRLNSELLGTVFIFADYNLPIEPLREELNKITDHHPLWDGRARNVLLTDLTENVMKIRILVSARSSGDAFTLRCFIREHMITFIQQNYPESLPKNRVEYLTKE